MTASWRLAKLEKDLMSRVSLWAGDMTYEPMSEHVRVEREKWAMSGQGQLGRASLIFAVLASECARRG